MKIVDQRNLSGTHDFLTGGDSYTSQGLKKKSFAEGQVEYRDINV